MNESNVQSGTETGQPNQNLDGVGIGTTEPSLSVLEMQDALKKAREEAAKYRTQLKEIKTSLTDKEIAEQKMLLEQGQFEKLYNETQKKLNEYETLIPELKTKAEMFEEFQSKRRETLLQQLPEDYKQNLEKIDTDTLEFLVNKLNKPKEANSVAKQLPGEDNVKPNPNPYQRYGKYADALSLMQKIK